jgi:hypothetical protein
LVEADQEIDLFEYRLQNIVLRHLDPQFNGVRKSVIQHYAFKPLANDSAVLLPAARAREHGRSGASAGAFQQGAAQSG